MFDSVGSALDTASGLLAGGEGGTGSGASGTAEFTKGDRLETPVEGVTDASAPNLDNVRDLPEIIEFIHFGFVHLSYTNVFTHPGYVDDEEIKDLSQGSRPRAIQFRAALEREAILLATFMQSTQSILQTREDDKGLLGDALDTVGSMTGMGGGGSGVTGPSDVNPMIESVKAAAASINATPVGYKEVHQAGRDLHQARADYQALLQKILEEKPQEDPAGGLMGKLPGVGSVGGPVGKIIAIAQGIAFKPMDIRVKFYTKLAAQQEEAIEAACNAMTLASLTPAYTPFLPVWFSKDREKWEAPDAPVQRTEDESNLLAGAQNKVADVMETGRQGAMSGVNAVKDFFENPKTDAPGAPFLSQAFGTPSTEGKLSEPFPMELGALAVKSFEEALGLTPPVVGFVESIIKVIMGIALDLTHGAMEAALHRNPDTPIDPNNKELFEAARHRMFQRLVNLALDKVTFLKTAKEFELGIPGGPGLKPGDLMDKGLGKMEGLVNDKLGSVLNLPLQYAMEDLATQLEISRQNGLEMKAHTMECYLGKLPYIQAQLFCDIFFPFWDALMDLVMDAVGGVLSGPLGAIQKAAGAAKGAVDKARDIKAKADAVQKKFEEDRDKLSEGLNTSDIGSTNFGQGYDDAMATKADEINGPDVPKGKFTLPIEGRLKDGEGKEITKDEWESVKPDHQWKEEPASDEEAPAEAGEEPAEEPAGGLPSVPMP